MINTVEGNSVDIRHHVAEDEDKILSLHGLGEGSGRRGRNWPFILTVLSFMIGALLAWSALLFVGVEKLAW